MKYWLSEVYAVVLHDQSTLDELKTFVRYPNGTWKAVQGTNIHDDRVMSLIWALMILETSITEQFFDIAEFDKNNKPAIIERTDFGERSFSGTLSLYGDERLTENYSTLPIYIDSETMDGGSEMTFQERDVLDLESQGWKFL